MAAGIEGKVFATELRVDVFVDDNVIDFENLDDDTVERITGCFEEGIAAGLNKAIEMFPNARVRVRVNGDVWNV